MFKLVIIGTIATASLALYHPVNEDIVKEIREKATNWIPMDVSENPLNKYEAEHVQSLMGTHIQEPTGEFR